MSDEIEDSASERASSHMSNRMSSRIEVVSRVSGQRRWTVEQKLAVLRDAFGPDGRLLMVNLTTADISDSAGAQTILDGIRKRWPWIKHLFADRAYDRLKLMDKASYLDFVVEVIRRSD